MPVSSCNGCGFCCEGIGSPVLVYASHLSTAAGHPFRPSDLPVALLSEIDLHFSGLFRGQEPQSACLWYDPQQRGCRHYEHRPQLCRDYERGNPACVQLRLKRQHELLPVIELNFAAPSPLANSGHSHVPHATANSPPVAN